MADRFIPPSDRDIRAAYDTPGMRAHLGTVAAALAAGIASASPRASGRLSRSWRPSVGDHAGEPVAAVSTDVPYWNIPEYGSVERSPVRYIDKGIRRTGIRYVPAAKNTGGEFA